MASHPTFIEKTVESRNDSHVALTGVLAIPTSDGRVLSFVKSRGLLRNGSMGLCRNSIGDGAVSVHPGLIETTLAHGWLEGSDIFGALQVITARILRLVSPLILETSDKAAQSVLFAALAPKAQASCGTPASTLQ